MELTRREFFKGLLAVAGVSVVPIEFIERVDTLPILPENPKTIVTLGSLHLKATRLTLNYESKVIRTEFGPHYLKGANITIIVTVNGLQRPDLKLTEFVIRDYDEQMQVTGNGNISNVILEDQESTITLTGCRELIIKKVGAEC